MLVDVNRLFRKLEYVLIMTYTKLLGTGIIAIGSCLIYIKRHLQDDSLLLGTGLILIGVLILTVGWIERLDSKRK